MSFVEVEFHFRCSFRLHSGSGPLLPNSIWISIAECDQRVANVCSITNSTLRTTSTITNHRNSLPRTDLLERVSGRRILHSESGRRHARVHARTLRHYVSIGVGSAVSSTHTNLIIASARLNSPSFVLNGPSPSPSSIIARNFLWINVSNCGQSFRRFAIPAIVLSYLYIRTTGELRPPDGPLSLIMFEARAEARNRQR